MQDNLVFNGGMRKKPTIGLDALDRAIESKGLVAIAEAIGVRYQLIQGWRDPERKYAVPAEYCAEMSRATGIPMEEFRPDIFGQSVHDKRAVMATLDNHDAGH